MPRPPYHIVGCTGAPHAGVGGLERDGYKCRECGRKAEYGGVWLEAHHRHPVSEGGSYAPWNLVLLCVDCHRRRHNA